jgi:isochorismate synthase EntC
MINTHAFAGFAVRVTLYLAYSAPKLGKELILSSNDLHEHGLVVVTVERWISTKQDVRSKNRHD